MHLPIQPDKTVSLKEYAAYNQFSFSPNLPTLAKASMMMLFVLPDLLDIATVFLIVAVVWEGNKELWWWNLIHKFSPRISKILKRSTGLITSIPEYLMNMEDLYLDLLMFAHAPLFKTSPSFIVINGYSYQQYHFNSEFFDVFLTLIFVFFLIWIRLERTNCCIVGIKS